MGDECLKAYVPFLLDLLSYAIDESGTDSAEFAARRPDLTIRSVEEFSKPQYGVDILKLEFPADLKWTREFSNGAFDGKERPPAYHLAEVRQYCRQLNDASVAPWVILSAGVDIGPPEFGGSEKIGLALKGQDWYTSYGVTRGADRPVG